MDSSTFSIRKVEPPMVKMLQQIGRQTFFQTFASANSEENMAAYLEEKFSEKQLIKELSNSKSTFYFALSGERVVGFLKVNFDDAQTELRGQPAMEIERIYVLNEFHGKGVGQALFEKALELAQQRSIEYIWLGVWEGNPRAIRFYEKNGFNIFDKHIFRLGDDQQTDLLMKRDKC